MPDSLFGGPGRASAHSDAAPGVSVRTLGCKVNQVESEEIAAALLGRGFVLAEDDAQVIVINTCTVTAEADRKARKMIRQALGLPQEPMVVATGCAATTARDALESLGDRVWVEPDKTAVVTLVTEAFPMAPSLALTSPPVPRAGQGFHARAMVKIEDGCDASCAYCIVPHARGLPRSVPATDVVGQVEALLREGVAEIVLTGINMGRYEHGGLDLPGLIEAVVQTGVPRIRLSSIEPESLTPELLSVAAATPAFCQHLHVPLQSGSDSVLHRMSRNYTAAEYSDRIARARSVLPDICITTDVMAGFPGESLREAEESLAFCEEIGFGKVHVFRYSQRPGTPAAAMRGQVEPSEAVRRAAELRELSERLRASWIDGRIGTAAEILVEQVLPAEEETVAQGTARDYTKVTARVESDLTVGSLLRVTIVGREGEVATGSPVERARRVEGDRI